MSTLVTIDYEEVGKENLKKVLINRQYYKAILDSIKKEKDGSIVLLEAPAEKYLEANITSVKSFLNKGFQGVYLSFQRPYNNISRLFIENDIDINELFIVDAASALCGEKCKINPRCVDLSENSQVDDIIQAAYKAINMLVKKKKFVFVDSLTTLALHEPVMEFSRFPSFLINTIRSNNERNVTFIFNVAKDLLHRKYIENVSDYADQHIHLGLCT